MSCASRTASLANLHRSFETAKRAPWYRRAFAFVSAALSNERRRQVAFELKKARQRGLLRDLDDHLLADIGLTRDQANREAHKPLWK